MAKWIPLYMMVALAGAGPAAATCHIAKLAELPITMQGRRPMVVGKFGDRDAHFILDSGAFSSTLSRATAAEFGLKVQPLPSFYISGVGGSASTGLAQTKTFSLAGIPLPKAAFIVGGSDVGTAGLIGQDILGLADVEYDLPHGVVRIMRTTDCKQSNLAYWAGDKPATMIPLHVPQESLFKPHTIGTILVNGVKVRAVFDTGAASSLLSLAAAKRAGVDPTGNNAAATGFSYGMGAGRLATWLATFDTLDIGGEAMRRPKIFVGDTTFGDAEMLIGVDFFLTHRIFVSNAHRKMFVTYEGGPMFGLDPKRAVTADGKTLDLADKAAEPKDAEGFSRRGAVYLANRKPALALADFDKACALAPGDGRYFHQRAMAHLGTGQERLARADLDKALQLAPANVDARLARIHLRLDEKDRDGAMEDLRTADRDLPPSSDRRMQVAALYDSVGDLDATVRNYDLWLASHREDSARSAALNGRCWARALLNRELDLALADCNAALKLRPGNIAYLDSRGLVQLRRGLLDKALADYDAALKTGTRNAWTLYARSIAGKRAGRSTQADADRSEALKLNPDIVKNGRKFGLES